MQGKNIQLTKLCHDIIASWASKSLVLYGLDATAGNGNDTLFLAKICEKVLAFDVQKTAIERTKYLLRDNSLLDKTELFNAGHENLRKLIDEKYHKKISIAMFNLGWLPKADKACITKTESTIKALQSLYEILNPESHIVSVLCYRGHDGGNEEYMAVKKFFENIPHEEYSDAKNEKSPVLLVASKSFKSVKKEL